MANQVSKMPTLDEKHFHRNKKTAWLSYLDKLTAWLWQEDKGAARWTLQVDDGLRHAALLHPPRTAAGLQKQVEHQSRLKHALVTAFGSHYPSLISQHPNTESLDNSGNILPFATNLLRSIGLAIVPEDAKGVSHATLEMQRQLFTFPGLRRGEHALHAWSDRISILYKDLERLTQNDQNQHWCSQMDLMILQYGKPHDDPISWTNCKDILHADASYAAAPTIEAYLNAFKKKAIEFMASTKYTGDRGKGKHFKAAYSAEALCWVCGSGNHNPRDCKMLNSALQDYRSKHLHGGRTKRTASRGSAFFNTRAGPSGGTSRGPPHNNGRGGHRGSAFKKVNTQKDQRSRTSSNYNKPSGSGFKKPYPPRDGPHAANLALPPSLPPPAYNLIPQDTEQHFAFETLALLSAPTQDDTRNSGTKRPYEDIEDSQDPINPTPPTKKRRLDDKSEVNTTASVDIYDVYQPHKENVDLKHPTDAIVIQDGDIDPNLVVSFSDIEDTDDKASLSAPQTYKDWVKDICKYYQEADSLPHPRSGTYMRPPSGT